MRASRRTSPCALLATRGLPHLRRLLRRRLRHRVQRRSGGFSPELLLSRRHHRSRLPEQPLPERHGLRFARRGRQRAPALRQQRPSARRSESQSWSHHRFCGRSRLDGDVSQTITTGLKRHSAAHALPRSPSSLEQPRTAGRTGDQLPAERASPRRIDRLEKSAPGGVSSCGLTQCFDGTSMLGESRRPP